MTVSTHARGDYAVIGSGITGLSAAWLLSQGHAVTLFEAGSRLGGHANTVVVNVAGEDVAVDTGFIVYNEKNYPNFMAMLDHLSVPTRASDMSFGVSLRGGALEYSSNDLGAFLGNGLNLLSPRFVRMTLDLLRFYRSAAEEWDRLDDDLTLGDYLDRNRYGRAFQEDHLLPEAAAIWSSSTQDVRAQPARSFIQFFAQHGLLQLSGRPRWRTIPGGSRNYVDALVANGRFQVETAAEVTSVRAVRGGVEILSKNGAPRVFDKVLIATHSDQALALAPELSAPMRAALQAIPYRPNTAVLHTDDRLMPRRKSAWASWNYVGDNTLGAGCAVTYWMNRLQGLQTSKPLFVSLNPEREPDPAQVLWRGDYDHPAFTTEGLKAQKQLWRLQGEGGIWVAGAWCGAGFHEDGLQAGLAAAEAMGGVRRPWSVPNESGRIYLPSAGKESALQEAA